MSELAHRWTTADESHWRELAAMSRRALDKPPAHPATSKLHRMTVKACKIKFPTADRARWPQLSAFLRELQDMCGANDFDARRVADRLDAVADILEPGPRAPAPVASPVPLAPAKIEDRPSWWTND